LALFVIFMMHLLLELQVFLGLFLPRFIDERFSTIARTIYIFSTFFVQGTAAYAVHARADGDPVSFKRALFGGGAHIITLLTIAILAYPVLYFCRLVPALIIGRLLPAPSIFYEIVYFVLTPLVISGLALAPAICVIEKSGPLRSFSRSLALTRHHRLRFAAMLFVLYLPQYILFVILQSTILSITIRVFAAFDPLGLPALFLAGLVAAGQSIVIATSYREFRDLQGTDGQHNP
jgi:hypothetical protein